MCPRVACAVLTTRVEPSVHALAWSLWRAWMSVRPWSEGTWQRRGRIGTGLVSVVVVVVDARSNDTVTVVSWLTVNEHVGRDPASGQRSPQLSKTEPAAGSAVSVMN